MAKSHGIRMMVASRTTLGFHFALLCMDGPPALLNDQNAMGDVDHAAAGICVDQDFTGNP
jgi:hypothetical protein